MCETKTKFGSDSGFKNRIIEKFDIRSNGFLIETVSIRHSNKKVNKSNFTCIECADKERFKTRPKCSLAYIYIRMLLYYLF